MKLLLAALAALVGFCSLPVSAQSANGASGATTYGPTSGSGGGPVGSTSVSPPESRATYSDSTRAIDKAAKDGAATKKTGGATVTFGPDDDSADGGPTRATPPPTSAPTSKTATQELKSGTSSTGGTGTSMDSAQARKTQPSLLRKNRNDGLASRHRAQRLSEVEVESERAAECARAAHTEM